MSTLWFENPQIQICLYIIAVLIVLIAILLFVKVVMLYKEEKKHEK